MELTREDKEMLEGKMGKDIQYAMGILVKIGEAFDAKRMINCDGAHLYSPALYAFAFSDEEVNNNLEHVKKEKIKVRTLATCCACVPDMEAPRQIEGFDDSYINKIQKCMEIYKEMGVLLTISCAPYLQGILPTKGEHLEYTESSDWIFANSVIGARSNRGGFSAQYAALTGRLPEFGMHLDYWRQANKIINVDANITTNTDVGALFFLVGKYCDQTWDVPVLTGIDKTLSMEDFKQASGAISSSGAAAMFHIVGITPEAPHLQAVIKERRIETTFNVTQKDLENAYNDLSNATTEDIDMVVLGCPHVSIAEMKEISSILEGKTVKDGVRVWIQTVPEVKMRAKQMGYLDVIERSGANVLNNTCAIMLVHERKTQSTMPSEVKTIATNQVKCAYFAPAQYDWGIWYGTTKECLDAAVTGKFQKK